MNDPNQLTETSLSALFKPAITYIINGQEAVVSKVFENGKLITKLTYSTNLNDTRK